MGRLRCQLIIDSWLPVHDTQPTFKCAQYTRVASDDIDVLHYRPLYITEAHPGVWRRNVSQSIKLSGVINSATLLRWSITCNYTVLHR